MQEEKFATPPRSRKSPTVDEPTLAIQWFREHVGGLCAAERKIEAVQEIVQLFVKRRLINGPDALLDTCRRFEIHADQFVSALLADSLDDLHQCRKKMEDTADASISE